MKLLKTLWEKVKKRLVRKKITWYTKKCQWTKNDLSLDFCGLFLLSFLLFVLLLLLPLTLLLLLLLLLMLLMLLLLLSFNWQITSPATFPYYRHNWSMHKLIIIGPFYEHCGSGVLFGELFAELAEKFPTEKIERLKNLMQCKYSFKWFFYIRIKRKKVWILFFIFFL